MGRTTDEIRKKIQIKEEKLDRKLTQNHKKCKKKSSKRKSSKRGIHGYRNINWCWRTCTFNSRK